MQSLDSDTDSPADEKKPVIIIIDSGESLERLSVNSENMKNLPAQSLLATLANECKNDTKNIDLSTHPDKATIADVMKFMKYFLGNKTRSEIDWKFTRLKDISSALQMIVYLLDVTAMQKAWDLLQSKVHTLILKALEYYYAKEQPNPVVQFLGFMKAKKLYFVSWSVDEHYILWNRTTENFMEITINLTLNKENFMKFVKSLFDKNNALENQICGLETILGQIGGLTRPYTSTDGPQVEQAINNGDSIHPRFFPDTPGYDPVESDDSHDSDVHD